MNYSDKELVEAALQRIAHIFGVPVDGVHAEHAFGKDLVASAKSDFKYGPLDQVLHDIRDVADRETIKRLDSGTLEIRTVGDYCSHMVRCHRTNQGAVASTLGAHLQHA